MPTGSQATAAKRSKITSINESASTPSENQQQDPIAVDAALRQRSLGALHILPDHLLSYVLYCLDLEDVCRLTCSSRLLQVLCCEEQLWVSLCLKAHSAPLTYQVRCV